MTASAAEPLLVRCAALLEEMFDETRVRFAYSTRLRDGRYVNDFETPGWLRYTVNTLLGVGRARRVHGLGPDHADLLERFLARSGAAVENPGDRGLLVRVLAEAGHDRAPLAARELLAAAGGGELRRAPLQDRCWAVLGLAAAARALGDDELRAGAVRLLDATHRALSPPGSALPGHDPSPFRRGMTSFGGIAYHLTALAECGRALEDDASWERFDAAVGEVLRLQGARGEWPWFIDVRRRAILDRYELYSVHQDAMAPLFLLPALDAGRDDVREPLERGVAWLFGANELGVSMVLADPFFIHRSIRRRERLPRLRRYARARLGGSAGPAPPHRLEVNRECRSYHLGWILYVWAGRTDFPELTRHPILAPGAGVGR